MKNIVRYIVIITLVLLIGFTIAACSEECIHNFEVIENISFGVDRVRCIDCRRAETRFRDIGQGGQYGIIIARYPNGITQDAKTYYYLETPLIEIDVIIDLKGTAEVPSIDDDPPTPAIPPVDPWKKIDLDYGDGWRLPNEEELNELYKQRNSFNLFYGWYWSSKEGVGTDPVDAYAKSFINGYWSLFPKEDSPTIGVRPVRNF